MSSLTHVLKLVVVTGLVVASATSAVPNSGSTVAVVPQPVADVVGEKPVLADLVLIKAAAPSAVATPVPVRKVVPARARTPVRKSAPPPAATQRNVRVTLSANLGNMQAQINRCAGPVAVYLRGLPVLIAQHDYCGGRYLAMGRRLGERLHVGGIGGGNGTYKVVSLRYVPKGTSISVLRGLGSVVLQSCAGNRLILVGLVRV